MGRSFCRDAGHASTPGIRHSPIALMLLSSADAAALQAIASTYVREAVHQAYAVKNADRHRWRRVARHGALSLFRERVPFGSTSSLAYDERKVGSRLFADPALFPASLLLGAISGDLDNLMLGLFTPSVESLALQQSYVGGARDSGIEERVLATVVAPSFHDPLRSLTLRWRGIKRSRHLRIFHLDDDFTRDEDGTVFIRSTGIAHLADGERVGYELVHSVGMALSGPGKSRRNGCHDPKISFCSIYRQRGRNTIDVYSLGAATPRLGEKLADFGADNGARKMRMLSRFEVCGQLQKLAWMSLAMAEPATLSSSEHSVLNRPRTCCASCFRSFSGVARIGRRIGQLTRLGNGGGTGVTECSMCSDIICGRCIVRRRLRFVHIGDNSDNSRLAHANQVRVVARSLPFCFKCIQRSDEMSSATVAAHALLDEDEDSIYDLGSGSCQAWCNYPEGTPTLSLCKSPASSSNQTFFCVDDDDTVEEIPVSDGEDSDVAECDVIRGSWYKRQQWQRLESNNSDMPAAVSDVDDRDLWTLESLNVASFDDEAFQI